MNPVSPSNAYAIGKGTPLGDLLGSVKVLGLCTIGKHCMLRPKGAHSANSPVSARRLTSFSAPVVKGSGASVTTWPTTPPCRFRSAAACNNSCPSHISCSRPGRWSGTVSAGFCAKVPARANSRPSLSSTAIAVSPVGRNDWTNLSSVTRSASPSPPVFTCCIRSISRGRVATTIVLLTPALISFWTSWMRFCRDNWRLLLRSSSA